MDRGREENINRVKAVWDENHQIFLKIQESGLSRIVKTEPFLPLKTELRDSKIRTVYKT